jgi:glycosyltransferase involved in cell wall biosynthesis
VQDQRLPGFDLVVATVDRADALRTLLDSLERQTHPDFRLLVVDQNADDRLGAVIGAHPRLSVERIRSPRGLSRARNAALEHLRADLVAFPDDDCEYPDDLLERVARRFQLERDLDGLSGRSADRSGRSAPSWKTDAAVLTRANLWNRARSFAIFLRREVVEQVGRFDERLGLGSGTISASGEEIDYLVRAVAAGARIAYDPDLVVYHQLRSLTPSERLALCFRDGASIGLILRKHRYGPAMLLRMLLRPVGGAAVSLLSGDLGRARCHLRTLSGRVAGYRGGREPAPRAGS